MPETEYSGVTWTVPQKGEKKKLLELSALNVKQYRADRLKRSDKLNPEQKHTRLMKELGNLLGMDKTPFRIECFDNSHISGTDAVAACVVYENGKPSRKDYRLYNIKSGTGGDDYGSMYEVMMRRWMRALDEGNPMPDLVIVDGGKGQMSVAKEVIDNLHISIDIAGLVKNDRHKTAGLLYGFPQLEVGVKPDSELFRLLEQMQEEVHRVAISFHKKKRSKRQTHSELTDIKGIGENTATALIKRFKSVKRIREASLEELTSEIGKSKAETIYNWYHK
jgi:excinuclease ABC subunit C